MNIISLVILNTWNKFTSPRALRITAMAALTVLVLTQLMIFLVVVPGFGRIPVTLGQSWSELLDMKGRSLPDIWGSAVNTLCLFVLMFKKTVIALGVLFLAAGVMIIDAFGDDVLIKRRVISSLIVLVLIGAIFALAFFELGAFLLPSFPLLTTTVLNGGKK